MKTLAALLKMVYRHRSMVIVSILIGFATIASGLGLIGTSAYLISRAALRPSIAVLQVAIVGVRFFGISRGLFRYLERLTSHAVNLQILSDLRKRFFDALEPLLPAKSQKFRSGDLLSRVTADVDILEYFFIRVVSPVVIAVMMTAAMGVFMNQFNPGLAWILVTGMMVNGLGVPLLTRLFTGRKNLLVETRGDLNAALTESLQGRRDLLAFNLAPLKARELQQLDERYQHAQSELSWGESLVESLSTLLPNLTMLLILIAAIPLVVHGELEGILLSVVTLMALSAFEAVQPLGQASQNLELSLQAASRLFSLENTPFEMALPAQSRPLLPPIDLSIQNLSFRYQAGEPWILEHLNLQLPPEKRVAVVGASGAGKTTLLNLLLRLWEYQEGSILLNGREIRNYSPETVRNQIAVISQRGYIFNRTLAENLRIAKPSASDAEIIGVIEAVGLGTWYNGLQRGLQTWLGELGSSLSGGEKQRILIARALLRNAPLWLLDEPTVHLDLQTEEAILQLLFQNLNNRSAIWVQNRLVGMNQMDAVLVLKHGRVVEQGTHDALLSLNGFYAFMWREQQASISS